MCCEKHLHQLKPGATCHNRPVTCTVVAKWPADNVPLGATVAEYDLYDSSDYMLIWAATTGYDGLCRGVGGSRVSAPVVFSD